MVAKNRVTQRHSDARFLPSLGTILFRSLHPREKLQVCVCSRFTVQRSQDILCVCVGAVDCHKQVTLPNHSPNNRCRFSTRPLGKPRRALHLKNHPRAMLLKKNEKMGQMACLISRVCVCCSGARAILNYCSSSVSPL